MLEVRDRSLPMLEIGGRAPAPVADDGSLADGDLISQEEIADAVGEEWESDHPVVRTLFDDLIRGEHAKAVMAEAEMRRVIEFNQAVDHRFQDGLGQLVARIPLSVYLHWTALYGHEFWNQDDSLDFLARRAGGGRGNPGMLIETKGRPTIIVDRKVGTSSGAQSAPGVCGKSSAPAGDASPAGATAPARKGPTGRRGRWAS